MSDSPIPIQPLKDNIVVDEILPEEKTPGGIIKVQAKEATPYRMGEVIAIGPGMTDETDPINSVFPSDLQIGSIVLFHRPSGWDVPWPDGNHYVVVSWRNVEAMISEEYKEWRKQQQSED